jgi:hypothetical protein
MYGTTVENHNPQISFLQVQMNWMRIVTIWSGKYSIDGFCIFREKNINAKLTEGEL